MDNFDSLKISNANIDSIVAELSCCYDQSHIDTVIQLNEFIIKSKSIPYQTIHRHYQINKQLYTSGILHELYFYEFKNKFLLEQIKNDIDVYLELLSNDSINTEKVLVIINSIKQSCINKKILSLSFEYIRKLNQLIAKLYSRAGSYSAVSSNQLINALTDLVDNYLVNSLATNTILDTQNITVNITPLDKNFAKEKINFSADENKKIYKDGSLVIKNLNIKDLNISETIYGVTGQLTFNLAYPNNHPDFDFLTNTRKPLLLDIEIEDTFKIKKENNEYLKKTNRFVVIGNTSSSNIKQKYNYNSTFFNKEQRESVDIKEFKISFNDPLCSLWSLHSPSYIDFNKSLDDIFKNNFFFDSLFSLNIDSEKLKKRLIQAFVSCQNRNFYDFFIEQLAINNLYLKYFCDRKTAKVSYFVGDKIDQTLADKVANKQQDIKDKLTGFDFTSLISQEIIKQELENTYLAKEITPDINIQEASQRYSENKIIETKNSFENIYKTKVTPNNYCQKEKTEKDTQNSITEITYLNLITARNNLPNINTDIDFSKLKKDKLLLCSNNLNELFISQKNISLTRSEYATQLLYKNIEGFYYKSNTDKDSFEKIAFCDFPELTHSNHYLFLFAKHEEKQATYPDFKSFVPYDVIGNIIIGDNVNENARKAYKFFKDFKPEETSIEESQENKEKGSYIIKNSKNNVLYAINVPKEIICKDSSQNTAIYAPVKINLNSAVNEFMPLRNDDIVIIKLLSLTTCEIVEIISNTAISTEKAQQQLLQRQLLGAKENCEIAYSQKDENEVYSITQENKENDNSIFIHNKRGIFLTYKAKGK